MKAGPCGTVFAAWEACVDANRDGGSDSFVESCMGQTRGLKECMEANPEYYGPLLDGDGDDEADGAPQGEAAAADAAPQDDAAPPQRAQEAAPASAAPQPAAPKERR